MTKKVLYLTAENAEIAEVFMVDWWGVDWKNWGVKIAGIVHIFSLTVRYIEHRIALLPLMKNSNEERK